MSIKIGTFVNLFTLVLAVLHLTTGWPGTWLLVFTPLWVTWTIWLVALATIMLLAGAIAIYTLLSTKE